ncbi:MAG: ArnT family glycosyltransferase [Cellvibrionaceae bacterium]
MAVILRIVWALLVPVIPLSDSWAYDMFAQNIWQFGTYGWEGDKPTSYWPVGTSAIYSLFYMVFGHVYWPIIIFNILCTIAIIIYTRLLCDCFFDDKRIGFYVSIAIALWPTLIFYTTVLASELPYMAFLTAAFFYFVSLNNSVIKLGIVSGILFAISYYIRPLAIIPLAIGVFYLFIHLNNKRVVILRSLISIIILVIAVAPWAYRNYQLYDAYVPMSTNGGATLWMGNQAHDTNGGYVPTPKNMAHLDEHTRNQLLKQEAIDYIKEEPVAFVFRTINKFIKFHLTETIGVTWNEQGISESFGEGALKPLKVVSQLYWSTVLLFALCGILLFIKNKGFWVTAFHPFILLWASTAAIHSLIVAQDRYHIPVVPLVAAFAIYFILWLIHYIESKKDKSAESKDIGI